MNGDDIRKRKTDFNNEARTRSFHLYAKFC